MDEPIKTYSLESLEGLAKELGQPSFRSKQIASWLYKHGAGSYDQMTNLPSSLRKTLAARFPLYSPEIAERQVSQDGTRKYLIRYHDDVLVETVAIPSRDGRRLTVCFSTQAGCPMACSFCATGREGLARNLAPGEIVDQIAVVQNDFGLRVSNLVGMGQGEPFLNYDNVLAALHILNHPDYFEIGARHIVVSTCGVVPSIRRFSTEPEQFTLAISLHSAIQDKREKIMPRASSFPLSELHLSLVDYIQATGRRVTLEYIMIRDVNDQKEDFAALASFCKGLLCHVNLIPMNDVEGSPFQPSPIERVERWKQGLNALDVETTVRESRGADINGACGQLRNSFKATR